jgi:hypothetical protein
MALTLLTLVPALAPIKQAKQTRWSPGSQTGHQNNDNWVVLGWALAAGTVI